MNEEAHCLNELLRPGKLFIVSTGNPNALEFGVTPLSAEINQRQQHDNWLVNWNTYLQTVLDQEMFLLTYQHAQSIVYVTDRYEIELSCGGASTAPAKAAHVQRDVAAYGGPPHMVTYLQEQIQCRFFCNVLHALPLHRLDRYLALCGD
ncbi:MAG: hypothetical protein JSS66_06370 [Armatimonadetes bacterium]|nr:hypothetical protein [Armatimonadota bacterium]